MSTKRQTKFEAACRRIGEMPSFRILRFLRKALALLRLYACQFKKWADHCERLAETIRKGKV